MFVCQNYERSRGNSARGMPGCEERTSFLGSGSARRAQRGLGRALAALALCALAGCSVQAPVAVPLRVEVPVAVPVYCTVPAMEKPALPIAALEADSSSADTIRAYTETVVILKGAVAQRDLVLGGCAQPRAQASAKGSEGGK